MTLAPLLLALAVKPVIERVLAEYEFDLVDAHYFYPDGVAAAMLGKRFGKPVVITARGTDVNLIPRYGLPRLMIRETARRAAGIITVAGALKCDLVKIGVPAERIEVLRNGVDLQLFRPIERDAVRRKLGLRGTTLLSVGHLIPRKGHDLVIQALPRLPETHLIVIGDGPERGTLEALARQSGVHERVTFIGARPQDELRSYYGAADALVLASSREGWANVLLEAMACGTPVVASSIGGTPEVVSSAEAGVLITERTPAGVAQAVQRLLACLPDRAATRRYAEKFSWDATTAGQLALFARLTTGI
jgi:glycosyltransferase involved in cell wall biosynthesis